MRRSSKSVRLLVAATLCIFGRNLYSQTFSSTASPTQDDGAKPAFTFKTATHLVLVDVVATDGKGKPVADLKAEDFAVAEDGHPQSVSSFSFQQPAISNDLQQTALAPLPPGVVTNILHYKKANIWNVIVLDALNSPMLDQSSTRQQLLKVIDRIPNQPAAMSTPQCRRLRSAPEARLSTTRMKLVTRSLKAWTTGPRTTRWLIPPVITSGTANSAASA